MNRFATILAATAVCCTFAAQAGTDPGAADATHITNGGSGYIGLTASAATSGHMTPMTDRAATMRTTTWPSTSQEAGLPQMAQEAGPAPMSMRTMGNARAAGPDAAMDQRVNRLWGTPD